MKTLIRKAKSPATKTPKVDFTLPALLEALPRWELVADCYDGEDKVKSRKYRYLPDPSPANEDDDVKKTRYDDYILRASYYNTVKRTAKGLMGMVFAKYPLITLNPQLEYLETNVDGSGASIAQHARQTIKALLLKGRCGLLVNYPTTEGSKTLAETKALNLKPQIVFYEPESIINWRTTAINNEIKLSLVVIRESFIAEDDGFEVKSGERILVLRLEDGVATAEAYHKEMGGWISQGKGILQDANGVSFDTIPFTFVGSDDNSPTIDDSPLYDIASISLSHFRNSADYEEGNFIAGQPSLFVTGIPDTIATNNETGEVVSWLDVNPIRLGSRNANLLPANSTATLLQAQANATNFEAMTHKEQQMVALGAKLLETNGAVKTATEANADIVDSVSILSVIANNASDAYTKCFEWCCRYVGVEPDSKNNVITLNTDYTTNKMTAQDLQAIMALWQAGAMGFEELRNVLIANEIASVEDVEEAKAIIEGEQQGNLANSLMKGGL